MEEELEIGDFEKLYALTSAKLNNPVEMTGYDESDFDKICTYSQFKTENSKMFSGKNNTSGDKEENYYMIPITIKSKYRINNKEYDSEKAYLLTDNNGYGLFVFSMTTKRILPTSNLAKQRDIAYWRYRNLIDKGEITTAEIDEAFDKITNVENIDDITKMIEENRFDLDNIQELIDQKITENDIELSQTPEEEENKIIDCKENSEEEIGEKSERMGITREALENLTKLHECSIDQISYRKVDDFRRVSDDIGLNPDETRGKNIIAVRINYYSKQKYYLVNVETGEHLRPHINLPYEDLPELEDYFKYHQQRESGEDYAVPIGYEMASETKYPEMTTIDDAGKVVKEKFVNNGRAEDMAKSERERYLAEVEERNQELSEKIETYQQEATPENWRAVNDALKARVLVDKKYSVLENQKRLTIDTLENSVEIMRDTDKEKLNKAMREENDDDCYDEHGRLIPGR